MSRDSMQHAALAGVWERLGKNRLLILGLVGVVALLALQMLWPSESLNQQLPNADLVDQSEPLSGELATLNDYRQALEQQLARTLSAISGVGEVQVMLSLASTAEAVPAMDTQTMQKTTEEKDNNGGTRVTKEESHSSSMVTGTDQELVTLQENLPTVTGVVIVAQGAESAEVRLALTRVVQTVLDVASYRIAVIPGK